MEQRADCVLCERAAGSAGASQLEGNGVFSLQFLEREENEGKSERLGERNEARRGSEERRRV